MPPPPRLKAEFVHDCTQALSFADHLFVTRWEPVAYLMLTYQIPERARHPQYSKFVQDGLLHAHILIKVQYAMRALESQVNITIRSAAS